MGTPEFAVPALKQLLLTQTVVGVVTQPDRPAGRGQQLRPSAVKVVAQAAGVPVYQPESLRREETAVPIREWQPDVIVVAAFGQILRPHLLNLPPHGCLNIHASLLPRWRGASPIHHAILHGDHQSGISLMQMDVGLDTGPVFVQEALPIAANETAVSLHDRLAELGGRMIGNYLNDILQGRLVATPQDNALSTYAPLIQKEEGHLDWTQSALALERRIRAMTPWPGAYTFWRGLLFKISQAAVAGGRVPAGKPGMVVQMGETAVVLCGEGGLVLQQVQLAGKKAVSASDFLRGQPELVGSQLGIITGSLGTQGVDNQ